MDVEMLFEPSEASMRVCLPDEARLLYEAGLDIDPLARLGGEARLLNSALVPLGGADQILRLPGETHLLAVQAAEVAPVIERGHLVQANWERLQAQARTMSSADGSTATSTPAFRICPAKYANLSALSASVNMARTRACRNSQIFSSAQSARR